MIGFYIAVGAVVGALLRWWLSLKLNAYFPTMPFGTFIANILGAFLIGIFMEITKDHAFISPQFRLLIVTGFLGSLTTFSTFSAETVNLIMNEQYFWSCIIVLAHVGGSLLATVSGIYLIKLFLFTGS